MNTVGELKEIAEAIMHEERWQDAINLLEAHPDLIAEDFTLAWDLGWAHLKLDDYEAAELRLKHATELRPRSAAAWWALGEVQRQAGKMLEAELHLKHALTLKDGSLMRMSLALALMERGKWAEAEQVHLKGLELEPKSPERWRYYACFLEDLGRIREAAEAAKKALRLAGH